MVISIVSNTSVRKSLNASVERIERGRGGDPGTGEEATIVEVAAVIYVEPSPVLRVGGTNVGIDKIMSVAGILEP